MTATTDTTRIVTRDGAALHCREQGPRRGPAMVFVASWSLPGESWRLQVHACVAAGLRCVTYDRRGHGASPDPGHGYDFDSLADDLAAVLDAYDLRDATLVTFSAGSGEAVRYLTRHGSGRVSRLAMIAPTTPLLQRRADHPQGIDPAYFERFVQDDLRQDWAGWLARNARDFCGPEASQAVLDWVIGMALRSSPNALEQFYRELTSADFRGELARLDLPVLVIQGDADGNSPIDLTGRPTVALVPGARLVVYAGAAHGLFVSHAERLSADLLAFAGAPIGREG